MRSLVDGTGAMVTGALEGAGRAVRLFAATIVRLPGCWRSLPQILRQIDVCGYGSVLVLALITGLTGMIMAMQTGHELQGFGLVDNLGAIIGATFCREMGPIWAAVIILARVGSAMAAELGTMTVNEEVDALRVMSIDPVRYLVVPRLAALLIAMPLLTAIADAVGLLGGAIATKALFNQPIAVFFDSAWSLLTGLDFWSGLGKSAVFACIIATIACDHGLETRGGAEGVGRAATTTVVDSVVFVLLANLVMTAFIIKVLAPVFG